MKIRYLTLIDSEVEEDHELSFFSGEEETKCGYKERFIRARKQTRPQMLLERCRL